MAQSKNKPKYNGNHPGGRPPKYSPQQIATIAEKLTQYIEHTEIPIVCEFAYKNGILRETLYDTPEFSTLLKNCIQKKEAALEAKALSGEVNVTMAIFSLKQIGWRDKTQVEHSGNIGNWSELAAKAGIPGKGKE